MHYTISPFERGQLIKSFTIVTLWYECGWWRQHEFSFQCISIFCGLLYYETCTIESYWNKTYWCSLVIKRLRYSRVCKKTQKHYFLSHLIILWVLWYTGSGLLAWLSIKRLRVQIQTWSQSPLIRNTVCAGKHWIQWRG